MRLRYQCSLEHLVMAFSYTLCQDGVLHLYYFSALHAHILYQFKKTATNDPRKHVFRIIVVCHVQRVCFQIKVQGPRARTPEGKALLLTTFTSVIKAHCTYTPCYTVICSISQKNIHSACVTILTCQKECSVFIL